jgi:hypothetical protein
MGMPAAQNCQFGSMGKRKVRQLRHAGHSGSPFTRKRASIGLAAQILEGGLRRGFRMKEAPDRRPKGVWLEGPKPEGFGLRPYLIYCFFFLAAFFFAAFFLAAITVSYG